MLEQCKVGHGRRGILVFLWAVFTIRPKMPGAEGTGELRRRLKEDEEGGSVFTGHLYRQSFVQTV